MELIVERAARIAAGAHAGQRDLSGAPYFEHPAAVARIVADVGGTTGQVAAAYLHDVIEDTDTTADDLRAAGFDEHIISLVDTLSRTDAETYAAYINRTVANPEAAVIKVADILHNTLPFRTLAFPPQRRESLGRRYRTALVVLGGVMSPGLIEGMHRSASRIRPGDSPAVERVAVVLR